MGRRLRIQEEKTIYFVTNRCLQQRMFLVPTDEVNRIVLAWLGRAVAVHGVKLLFFVFMSNHFHLGVLAPKENLERFMAYFQGNLAKSLNRLHGRSGPIFGRRYSAEPILDDASLLDKMLYTLQNPVKADLVEHPAQWPGVSSWSSHMSGAPLDAVWTDGAQLRRLRRRNDHRVADEMLATVHYPIEVERLPEFGEYTQAQFAAKLNELVADRCEVLKARRKKERKKVLGPGKVRSQKYFSQPRKPSAASPQPLCHTINPVTRAAYRQMVKGVTTAYRRAMRHWRQGQLEVRFPRGTIPPGWIRCVGDGDLVKVIRDTCDDFG
ncbi:MAG: hypothetical protein H0U74_05200 [Bradymonadaceae bacterium]|nr:hypothetical protein [Lujinxingiaceae bacterium]